METEAGERGRCPEVRADSQMTQEGDRQGQRVRRSGPAQPLSNGEDHLGTPCREGWAREARQRQEATVLV